jgi:hypothetical protein
MGQPPAFQQIPSVQESPQHQQPLHQQRQEEVLPPVQQPQLIPPPYLYETPAGRPEQRQHVRFERDNRRRHRRDSTSSEDKDLDDNPNLPITERIPGNDYFDTLPAPWNVRPVPRSRHDRNTSVDKADALKRLKLTGSVGSYLSWRPTFISYVHIRPVRLYEKCQAMMNSIDSTEPQLEPVITILRERQGDAYRRAIEELENRFGGIDRVRDHYLDRLDAHPPVRAEDFYSLDVFITFISSIHDAFRQNDLEYEMRSGKFLRTIKDKVPASYLDRYQEWMAIQHPGQRQMLFNLPTLVTWLKDKRERIRQLQKDVQAKAKANKKPATTTRQFLTLEDALDRESDQDDNEPIQHEPEVQQADDVEQIYVTREGRQLVPTCTLCPGQSHLYRDCPKFKAMTPADRRKHLRDNKECYRCFRKGHGLKDCRSKIKCKKCGDAHNTLVCPKKQEATVNVSIGQDASPPQDEETPTPEAAGLVFINEEDHPRTPDNVFASNQVDEPRTRFKCSLPIVAITVKNPVNKKKVVINALLDEGANRTSMSMAAAEMIGLKGRPLTFRASGFGDSFTEDTKAMEAEIIISPTQGKFTTMEHRAVVVCLSHPLGDLVPDDWSLLRQNWPHLKDLQMAPVLVDSQVHMIIGTDNFELQQAKAADITGPTGSPGARLTVFGWIPRGRIYPKEMSQVHCASDEIFSHQFFLREINDAHPLQYYTKFSQPHITRREENFRQLKEAYDKDLLELLKLQYRVDEGPEDEPDMSLEDRYAYRRMKASEIHTGERYQVDCLWKKGEPKLVHNKLNTVGRYRRLQRHPLYQSKYLPVYEKTLKEYLDKSYIEEVPEEEARDTDSFYLPHFVVSKETDGAVKYRIVFDGAAKYANKSLNDAMAKGPNFIADLVKVLIQFRLHPIALTMDVKEMFLQVEMAPQSRRYHRFVFQWPHKDDITEYQFTRHPFGSTGSPCIAMHIVRERAIQMRDQYPAAANLILELLNHRRRHDVRTDSGGRQGNLQRRQGNPFRMHDGGPQDRLQLGRGPDGNPVHRASQGFRRQYVSAGRMPHHVHARNAMEERNGPLLLRVKDHPACSNYDHALHIEAHRVDI